jgi:hypothetical protein
MMMTMMMMPKSGTGKCMTCDDDDDIDDVGMAGAAYRKLIDSK